MRSAEEKIPGGKLVKLIVQEQGGRFVVQVSGDFFIHPEHGLTYLEEALGRLKGNETEAEMEEKIKAVIEREKLELIGVDVQAITSLFRKCLKCGE